MKRVLEIFTVLAILLINLNLEIMIPVNAASTEEVHSIFLPIVLKDPGDEPIWIKNPTNLPPANGWPGWSGQIETQIKECSNPPCYIHTNVQNPPYYLVIEGKSAILPVILGMGNPTDGCFAIVVSESYAWLQGAIVQNTSDPIIFKWMAVPDPAQAPPLEWLAEAKAEVLNTIPTCTDLDVAVYGKPSNLD